MRAFWSNFYNNVNAILFVVNCASSQEDLLQSKVVLSDVLSDRRVAVGESPCLILGTHSDLDGARDAAQLKHFFSDVMMDNKWDVRTCCAFNGEQVKSSLQVLVNLMVHRSSGGTTSQSG